MILPAATLWRRWTSVSFVVVAVVLANDHIRAVDRDLVMRRKTGEAAKVHVWHDAVVSCKGQVWVGDRALVGCGKGGCGISWDGCGFSDGTCVWDSGASHVSKKPYCVKGGPCVPHAPGPAEKDSEKCRAQTEEHCLDKPGIVGGHLETIVVLTQPQWGAYYHFLVDGFTRIVWVYQQYPEVIADGKTHFHTGLVDDIAQAWARLVGIETADGKENRLLDGWWKANTIYFPPGNACANERKGAEPDAVQGFQKLIANNFVSKLPTTKEKPMLLIVRRDERKSKSRSILNHKEVLESVEKWMPDWSVEVFSDYPESPSTSDTCKMFFRAGMIIGPHGAGFANLLCAQPGTPLIEFQQKNHAPDYELLTMKLNMPYVGVRTDLTHDGPGTVKLSALHDAVRKALDLAVKRHGSLSEAATTAATIPETTTSLPIVTSSTVAPSTVPLATSTTSVLLSQLIAAAMTESVQLVATVEMTTTIEAEESYDDHHLRDNQGGSTLANGFAPGFAAGAAAASGVVLCVFGMLMMCRGETQLQNDGVSPHLFGIKLDCSVDGIGNDKESKGLMAEDGGL